MGREERGPPGGTVALLAFVEEHRAALRFDFRHRFPGIADGINGIGTSVLFGEALDLVVGLLKETGSHLVAEIVGLTRPLSWADIAVITLTESYLNAHRDPKKSPKPFTLFEIWEKQDPNADVTPERRRELEEQLERRSAFAS